MSFSEFKYIIKEISLTRIILSSMRRRDKVRFYSTTLSLKNPDLVRTRLKGSSTPARCRGSTNGFLSGTTFRDPPSSVPVRSRLPERTFRVVRSCRSSSTSERFSSGLSYAGFGYRSFSFPPRAEPSEPVGARCFPGRFDS